MDWKLELVFVPVSDVDRAKDFYVNKVGFNADYDERPSDSIRFVQLTPPGSACSICIGEGLVDAPPGTVLFDGGVWGQVRDNMPGFFEQMIKRNPTGRMATPEEIAAATVFLASPRSAFTTGINMVVDGAISARANFEREQEGGADAPR